MLSPVLKKNDKQARILIGIFSVVVLAVVIILGKVKLEADLGFDVHIFAGINAALNATIALLLLAALAAVKAKKYELHKRIMLGALLLSLLFLVSYIAHHLLAGDTKFGDINGDGLIDAAELVKVGAMRMVYVVILLTHIFLAAVTLPFILFTAYRGLTSEFGLHKRLSRIIWPLWFYVAVTGPIVYLMIRQYY